MFNQPNYQRFATTHFIDLHFVENASPQMLKLLKEAVYSVNKSGRRFISMHTDQNHEQVKFKNWAMPASRISSKKYLLTINGQCSTHQSKTTQDFLRRQPSRILPKYWQRNPQTFLLTCLFIIAAQQRNTNEVSELLKWEVALPPFTIPTTGAVKFASKASMVESLVSFKKTQPSNNDTIFMDRGVTTVILTLLY